MFWLMNQKVIFSYALLSGVLLSAGIHSMQVGEDSKQIILKTNNLTTILHRLAQVLLQNYIKLNVYIHCLKATNLLLFICCLLFLPLFVGI